MKDPVWVLPKTVIAVHQMLLAEHGGAPGVRDAHLLDSALNRPRQKYAYDATCSIFDLAASYCFGLVKNHPFIDGNKRIALTVAALFLEINDYSLSAPEPETVLVIEGLAAGQLTEKTLAEWFEQNTSTDL